MIDLLLWGGAVAFCVAAIVYGELLIWDWP